MNSRSGPAQATLPQPLRFFWIVNVALSLSCAIIMRASKYLLHLRYPYTSPFNPFRHWVDFTAFHPRFEHFHHLDFFSTAPSFNLTFMYPAPEALLYEIFYLPGWHSTALFLFVTGSGVLLLGALLGRAMVERGVRASVTWCFLGSALLFSYPFWFEYVLGNTEVCIFLLVAAGILALLRDRLYLFAGLIGMAASMKIYPFIYLGLLISRRRYREFGFGVLVAALMNVVSMWLVCPSLPVAYRGITAGLNKFRHIYVLRYRPMETGFDHSIFGFVKAMLHHWIGWNMPQPLLSAYLALACVAGLALYFLRIRHLPLLNQVLCLCIASIVLPPTSHDYTLIHLYVPWGLMVLYAIDLARAGYSVAGLRNVFLCFAILMSAESELIYKAGYSGQLKCITLVVLLVIALRRPWLPVEDVV